MVFKLSGAGSGFSNCGYWNGTQIALIKRIFEVGVGCCEKQRVWPFFIGGFYGGCVYS